MLRGVMCREAEVTLQGQDRVYKSVVEHASGRWPRPLFKSEDSIKVSCPRRLQKITYLAMPGNLEDKGFAISVSVRGSKRGF